MSKNSVNSLEQVPEKSWIVKDGRYMYNDESRSLPYEYPRYKSVLKLFKIPYMWYTVNDDCGGCTSLLVYWHPDYPLEKELVTAPLYEEMPDGTYCATRDYTGLVYTEKTCIKAQEKLDVVDLGVKWYDSYDAAKKALAGKVCNIQLVKYPTLASANFDGNIIKCFTLKISSKKYLQVLFDITKIRDNEYTSIILDVPKSLECYVRNIMDSDAKALKSWIKQVGVDNIYVCKESQSPWLKNRRGQR